MHRRHIYELPVRAIREAIINAAGHRSYLDDSCIQLSIYDDRVDIFSPGGLYGGLDITAALNGKSKCRNAAISEAFHYMKLMETWGTGLKRILNSCKEYELPEPLIEEDGYGFRVTFYRKSVNGTNNPRTDISSAGQLVQSGNPAQSGTAGLPDQEQIIINFVRKNGQCTTALIADLLNVKDRRARSLLGNLVKKAVLSKEGKARNTVYLAGTQFPEDE